MAERTTKSESNGALRIIRPLAGSVLIGILCCAFLLLLMSFVMSMTHVPQLIMEPMTIFALCTGAFISGFVCFKAVGEKGLVNGALTGTIISLVVLIARVFMGYDFFEISLAFRIIFVVLSSMIGGTVAINTKPRRK